MSDVHDALNTLSAHVHDALNTPGVYDALNTDNYRLREKAPGQFDDWEQFGSA